MRIESKGLSIRIPYSKIRNSLLAYSHREDVFVYAGRVAEDDEAQVVHVLLRDALHVLRGNGPDAFKESAGVTPAAAD
jgi:hypothetical protein